MGSIFVNSRQAATCAISVLIASVAPTPVWAQGEYEGATQCRGNMVRQVGVADSRGRTVASLELFYSRSEDLFCAKMRHVGPLYDVRLPTEVALYKSETRRGPETLARRDRGDYLRYAGPIGARGKCMNAKGSIRWDGNYVSLTFQDRFCA